jgi:hypothetical protein
LVLSWGRLKQKIEQEKELEFVTDKVFGTNNICFGFINFFYNRGYTSNLQARQNTRTIRRKEGTEYSGYEFNTFSFRSFN